MSQASLHNEKELFQRIAEGDEQAFRIVFLHYYPRLLPFAIRIARTRQAAEEIVQEVFLRLWKHRTRFEYTDHLSSWLFTVAANQAYSFLKKAARQGQLADLLTLQPEETYNETDARMDWKATEKLVAEAVSRLTPQQQQVFILSRQQGLSHVQIAERLTISRNTVKNHLVKALQSIREHLKQSTHTMHSGLFIF